MVVFFVIDFVLKVDVYLVGKIFKDCDVCFEMIVVLFGFFCMGDLNGGGDVNEKFICMVIIFKKFVVGV